MVYQERVRVFMKNISYRSELTRVGPAPKMSETGPKLFFEPISCKLKQGFEWEVI